MHTRYFQPERGWLGDIMPCYHDGVFYFYYQCDTRDPAPFPNGTPFGWSLATTTDLLHFEDHGEVLHPGNRGGREEWLYAGSVIHAEGCFRAFYTGHCPAWTSPEQPPAEALMLATSEDGVNWVKRPELTFAAPKGYEKDFFRDPHVFYSEEVGRWLLIVPARRLDGPAVRRSAMLYYTSDDLERWSFQGELWYPKMFHLLQMPDLFRIGDWWYMFFSEYCDERKTRYRMSRSLDGPWLAPPDDSLDSRCFYAARTIAVGDRRYLFGWNPTRADDLSPWVWGGTAVVHELVQRADGTLGVVEPEQYRRGLAAEARALTDMVTLARVDGCDERTVLQEAGDHYRLTWAFTLAEGTQSFGVRLHMDSESDVGYTFEFRPAEGTVGFDKLPMQKWFTYMDIGMQRPVALTAGVKHTASLVVDGDIAVLYVDDVTLSARICEKPGSELRLYVNAGSVECSDIEVHDLIA